MEKADEDCSCRRIPGPLLGLAAVANADAIYDFSYVGYLDEDLTMAAPHGRPPGGSLRAAHT